MSKDVNEAIVGREDTMVSVNYVIPKAIQEEISKAITDKVIHGYYGGMAEKISDIVLEKLKESGMIDRVADAVLNKVQIEESEWVENLSKNIKDSLISTTSIITKEVLDKVQERVKSYGFIKIGDRY